MKILLIRLSSIGDVLLATPVVRCLKKQLEDCEVHFLTKSNNLELIYNNPFVDKVVTYQDSFRLTLSNLKDEHYDLVVDLHNNRRSRMVRRGLHIKSYVYRKENLHKWLTILTKHDFMSGCSVVERYLKAVAPLGVNDDGEGLQLFLPDELCGNNFNERMIGHKKVSSLTAVPYTVIACGAQHETKRIPIDKLVVLASLVKSPVLLLGDAADRKRIRDWGASFGQNVVNLCGKTTLLESAALVRDAAVVITPDSAMMHFAAAFQRPVISLWGATSPRFGFSAFRTSNAECTPQDLWCHPCSRMGGKRCPLRHYRCMHDQKWQQIANAATRLAEESHNPETTIHNS